jgi:hypothetical protein
MVVLTKGLFSNFEVGSSSYSSPYPLAVLAWLGLHMMPSSGRNHFETDKNNFLWIGDEKERERERVKKHSIPVGLQVHLLLGWFYTP